MIPLQIYFFLKSGLNPQPRKTPSFAQKTESYIQLPQLQADRTNAAHLQEVKGDSTLSSFSARPHARGGPVGGAVAEVTRQ